MYVVISLSLYMSYNSVLNMIYPAITETIEAHRTNWRDTQTTSETSQLQTNSKARS